MIVTDRDAKLWVVGGSVGVLGLVLGYFGGEWRRRGGGSGSEARVQVSPSRARGRGEYGSSRDHHERHKHHKEHERGKH
jgi:hypothetical protein